VNTQREAIHRFGATVLTITQSKPESLRTITSPFEILCDPDRQAFHYFGLERGRFGMFFRLHVLWYYIRSLLRGFIPRRVEPGEDALQLGGDFVISADRRLIFAHPSRDPADRPSVSALIECLKSAAAKSG
jgi:hypothetical protein